MAIVVKRPIECAVILVEDPSESPTHRQPNVVCRAHLKEEKSERESLREKMRTKKKLKTQKIVEKEGTHLEPLSSNRPRRFTKSSAHIPVLTVHPCQDAGVVRTQAQVKWAIVTAWDVSPCSIRDCIGVSEEREEGEGENKGDLGDHFHFGERD